MEATGGYIRTLREKRGLSQNDVAIVVGVEEMTVRRWEHGKNEPSVMTLVAAIKAVCGSVLHLEELARRVTYAEGAQLAEEWFAREQRRAAAHAATLNDVDLQAVIDEFEAEATQDTAIISAWRGFVTAWRFRRDSSADVAPPEYKPPEKSGDSSLDDTASHGRPRPPRD